MTTYGYLRVSTSEQINGSSPEDQRRVITHIAGALNQPVAELFEDLGVGGAVPFAQRPAGSRLVAQLAPGDVVIAAKLDRAFRNTKDCLVTVEDWKARGIRLILVDLGLEPVTNGNAVARLFFTILAAFATFERDKIAERCADGKSAKKARGGHIGGSREFGYRIIGRGRESIREADEAEQKALRRMRRLRAKGLSLRAIAADLAQAGHALSHVGVKRALERKH